MSSIFLTTAMTICFVAGKSGGHLLPCITQAKNLHTQNAETKIYLFSSGSSLDHTIVDQHNFIEHITPTTLTNPPYKQPWLMPWFILKTWWYFCKSVYKLHYIKPNKVVSFGGFVSIPTCLAAKVLGIPFEIYELNVEPGKATNFLSKFTKSIHTCFPSTQQYFPNHTCIHFDYPIRFDLSDKIFDRSELYQKYQLLPERTTILILGGSQGSILLSETFKNYINGNPQANLQVIHQTGASDPFDYAAFYQQHNIPHHVFSYCPHLQDFYNVADIIICRAGAGTLFEILFFNKKCITIPHETAQTNHQIKNVIELQKQYPELFTIIKQSDFNVLTLQNALLPYLS